MGLREILQRNGLTQEACARGIDVSLMTVGNWVRGRSIPTGTNQARLLAFLQRFEPGLRLSDLAEAVFPPRAGDFVIVSLEDGTEVRGKIRDVVGAEAWIFVSGSRASELHDEGGTLTVPLTSVRREEAA